MNRRIIISLLGGGIVVIALLLGFCIFKMQHFKSNLEKTLNNDLMQISQELALNEIQLNYTPFECSGLFFIECKNSHLDFISKTLNQKLFSSRNLVLSLEDIDFKSIALSVTSQLEIANLGDLQEYSEAFFPKSFKLNLTIKPQDNTSYTIDTELNLNANNVQYIENFQTLLNSPRIQEMGLFRHISSLAFLDEGFQIQDFNFTLISKDLSNKLFEIAQSKYGSSLDETAYITLINFLAEIVLADFSSKPYYPQIEKFIDSFLQIILWNANKMQVFITPKSKTPCYTFSTKDVDTALDTLFSSYDFDIKLSK